MALVNLKTCENLSEAYLIKNMLENEGIDCFVGNENFAGLYPGMNRIMGMGIQIMINEDDTENALRLIKDSFAEDAVGEDEVVMCPYCDSTNTVFGLGKNKVGKIAIAAISSLVAVPFNNINNTYYCKDCKADFKR